MDKDWQDAFSRDGLENISWEGQVADPPLREQWGCRGGSVTHPRIANIPEAYFENTVLHGFFCYLENGVSDGVPGHLEKGVRA